MYTMLCLNNQLCSKKAVDIVKSTDIVCQRVLTQ